jgi:hypothetical protein
MMGLAKGALESSLASLLCEPLLPGKKRRRIGM